MKVSKKIKLLSLERAEAVREAEELKKEQARRRKLREKKRLEEANRSKKESQDDAGILMTRFNIHPTKKRNRCKATIEKLKSFDDINNGIVQNNNRTVAMKSWSSLILNNQKAKDKKVIDHNKTLIEKEQQQNRNNELLYSVQVRCKIPKSVTHDAHGNIVIALPKSASATSSPAPQIGGSAVVTPPPNATKKKGKQIRLMQKTVSLNATITSIVSQRIIDLKGLSLCFGTIFLTPSTKEEDIKRSHVEKEKTNVDEILLSANKVYSSKVLEGQNFAQFIPIRPEDRKKNICLVDLNFNLKTSEVDCKKFTEVMQQVLNIPVSEYQRGNINSFSTGFSFAREFMNFKNEDNFVDQWEFHNKESTCLITSVPELQVRGDSRPYLTIRYVGLAGKISFSCEKQSLLNF